MDAKQKTKLFLGWTIPLPPFGLQCMTEVCLLYYSFPPSVFSCLSQNSKEPYAVDLCMSAVKLWRTVCTGNGKMKCITWAYESFSKTLKMNEVKNSNPICTFLVYPFKLSLSGKLKMYRRHLFWFYSPPSFKVMKIHEIVLIQVNNNLSCSCLLAKKLVISSHIKSLFSKWFVPFRCNLINWSLTFAFIFIKHSP